MKDPAKRHNVGDVEGATLGTAKLVQKIRKSLPIDATEKQKIQELSQPGRSLWKSDIRFSSCPAEQLEACCFYEYARESRKMIARAAEFHGGKLVTTPDPSRMFTQEDIARFHLGIIADCPEFPKTAWLDLPAEKRDKLAKRKTPTFAPHNLRVSTFQELDPEENAATFLKQVETLRIVREGLGEHTNELRPYWLYHWFRNMFLIQVDLERDRKDLLNDFKEWIDKKKAERKCRFGNPNEKRGRVRHSRDDLRALSAFRIHRALPGWSFEKLAHYFGEIYRSSGDWSTACDNCNSLIANRFGE